MPLLTVLRWIGQTRGLLFHGSPRDDLDELRPVRRSRDTSPFGDQQAVYATSDPVWAIYFATLRRDGGFRSTRNGSLGFPESLYPRWYFFSHNREADPATRFGDGWLYVVRRVGFRPEALELGVLDTAHWAARKAVSYLVRVPVSPRDFPFVDRVGAHREDERVLVTLLRVATSAS